MSNPTEVLAFHGAIQFQSRFNPHATAVAYQSRSVSYRTFAEHIDNVTRRLHSQQIAPGSRVAVSVSETYLHWLVVIALSRMGLPSVSLAGFKGEADFVRADVVVRDGAEVPGRHNILVQNDWIPNAGGLPPFEDRRHNVQDPCRIVLSSGTTGLPKKALFTYGHLLARSRGTARAFGINAATRLLTTMSITTIGGFWTPVNVWANGGTVILTPNRGTESWGRVVARTKPNVLFTSTAQLDGLIKTLPREFWPMEHMVAYVAGSALPLALNRTARLRLTQSLYMLYGSTEAGATAIAHAAVADRRPGFTGFVVPLSEVQVIDEAGQPVPAGTVGEVRIRAEGLVDQYLEDTDANDGSFREGWFYPGDAGQLDAEGGLTVIGRTRELMNFGGVKVAPDTIENALARHPGMEDLAVFAVSQVGKEPRPHVAVVAQKDFNEDQLKQFYRKTFPVLPPLTVVRVAAIPRNEMGKTLRTQLANEAQQAAQAGAGAIADSRPR